MCCTLSENCCRTSKGGLLELDFSSLSRKIGYTKEYCFIVKLQLLVAIVLSIILKTGHPLFLQ